jgi:hypothetical protein
MTGSLSFDLQHKGLSTLLVGLCTPSSGTLHTAPFQWYSAHSTLPVVLCTTPLSAVLCTQHPSSRTRQRYCKETSPRGSV